jgi:hypothetical protein
MVQQEMEQQSANLACARGQTLAGEPVADPAVVLTRFARLPWGIYTSHSSYSHYYTD